MKITDKTPLYNSRIVKFYINLIKQNYNYININELLQYAKMTSYQVDDEGHWFTQEQVDLFYEKLVKLTGNKNIAREAGRSAASLDSSSFIKKYIIGLLGPANAYENVGNYAPEFTKSAKYESKKISKNKIEISVKPYKGVKEKPFQCENRIGMWEAISLLFNYRIPKIEHPECIFKGDKSCKYIISWQDSKASLLNKMKTCLAALMLPLNLVILFLSPNVFQYTLPSSIIIILSLSLLYSNLKLKEFNFAINNLKDASDKLLEQMQLNYDQALTINEIGQSLNKEKNVEEILTQAIKILKNRFDYDRGMILLANEQKTELIFKTGFGYDYGQFEFIKNIKFHLDKPESRGPFVVSFREKRPILVNDIDDISWQLSSKSFDFAKKIGTKSFICCPLIYGEESIGILAVDNIKSKRPLLQRDVNLLMGIAMEIAISLTNAKLLEMKERQFHSTLRALAASIDARDSLTKGHSERVADYAVGICKELNLPDDFTEMVRVAALLHDYGKIGVPDSILKKEGPLTPEEYEEIKSHVTKTEQIIKQIEFDKKYKDILNIISGHHEKMDGSGYPNELAGEEIPLGAKIIAVADFFDAITSKRHYRDAFPLDEAFNLLIEKRGIHYDEIVVDAFIRFFTRNYMQIMTQKNKLILN